VSLGDSLRRNGGVHPLIYMLLAYSKGERDDLSAREKKILRQLVEEEFQ
jgi:hypothetical protein